MTRPSPAAPEPLVLTVREAAERLRCCETTVRRLLDAGELIAIDLGRSSRAFERVTVASLHAFLARGSKRKRAKTDAAHGTKSRRRRSSRA